MIRIPAEDAASQPGAASSLHCIPAQSPLDPTFFADAAEIVARKLLGTVVETVLCGVRCAASIVETEAYVGPHDEASHAHARVGMTSRNQAMYGPPGHAYVYRSYGIHWCLNAVTEVAGYPAAVLIRAARPLLGTERMTERRPGRGVVDLLRGPGNLTRALGIDGSFDTHPLDRLPLRFLHGTVIEDAQVAVGPRVGISRAVDWPLRFWIAGDLHVSQRSANHRTARRMADTATAPGE